MDSNRVRMPSTARAREDDDDPVAADSLLDDDSDNETAQNTAKEFVAGINDQDQRGLRRLACQDAAGSLDRVIDRIDIVSVAVLDSMDETSNTRAGPRSRSGSTVASIR